MVLDKLTEPDGRSAQDLADGIRDLFRMALADTLAEVHHQFDDEFGEAQTFHRLDRSFIRNGNVL